MEPVPKQSTDVVETELQIVKPENQNDPRYFYLRKAIEVDGRELKFLMLDPDLGEFSGRDFFKLDALYRRKYPEEVARQSTPWQKYTSESYLSLVIAKLNKITPEDLYKVPYKELSKMFLQASPFQFSEILDNQATE